MDEKTQKVLESNPTVQIMYDHFMNQFHGDQEKTFAAINYLGEQVQHPGCKLIHLGNVVFLITVSASRMVEMHAMMGGKPSKQEKLRNIDKELDSLLPILKDLDVKLAYTYMKPEDAKEFRDVLKEYKFYEKPAYVQGKKVVAFYVEV